MTVIEDTISQEKLQHYLSLTKQARAKATPIHPDGSQESEMLAVLLRIDAGIKLKLLDGHGDDNLFTLP